MKSALDEIAIGMHKNLNVEAAETATRTKIAQALSALDEAAKFFDDAGDIKTAEIVTQLLVKIAEGA